MKSRRSQIKSVDATILVITVGVLLTSHHSPLDSVYAATSSNQDFMLNVEGIDTDPEPTKLPILPSLMPSPTIAEFTTGPNYTVHRDESILSIALSQNSIDFGILSANNPIIRTSELQFTPPSFGAQVFTYENQPLTNAEKLIIPDTTCDNGLCTHEQSVEWSSTFTYGFGYRCESAFATVCNDDLSESNHFKQYPDISRTEPLSLLMKSTAEAETTTGTIIYKLNITGTQQPGTYTNTITYIAVPNF